MICRLHAKEWRRKLKYCGSSSEPGLTVPVALGSVFQPEALCDGHYWEWDTRNSGGQVRASASCGPRVWETWSGTFLNLWSEERAESTSAFHVSRWQEWDLSCCGQCAEQGGWRGRRELSKAGAEVDAWFLKTRKGSERCLFPEGWWARSWRDQSTSSVNKWEATEQKQSKWCNHCIRKTSGVPATTSARRDTVESESIQLFLHLDLPGSPSVLIPGLGRVWWLSPETLSDWRSSCMIGRLGSVGCSSYWHQPGWDLYFIGWGHSSYRGLISGSK